MRRTPFRTQSKEEIAEKLQAKRLKLMSPEAKQARQRKLQEKRSKTILKGNKAKVATGTTKKKTRKRTERQKAEDQIWELCKKIIRKKYPNNCYTCSSQGLEGMNWQTGHGKPKGALPLRFKYDLRNLKPQCMHDNYNLGGCSDIFIAKLEREEEGLAFLTEACVKVDGVWTIRKDQTMGGTDGLIFLKEKIKEYQHILAEM